MHLGALPPAFAGLEPDDSSEAAAYLQPMALDAGDLVMQQGEEDSTLAFVVQGAVQLLDDDVRVGGAGTRDMLGEVEVFHRVPRIQSASASAPTHLLVLAQEHWQELCERGNPAVYNIERFAHRRIGERLRWLNEGIAERTKGTPFALHPRGKGLIGQISKLLAGGGRGGHVDAESVLAQSALFNWAEPSILADIARSFEVERFDTDTVICRQGEIGEKVYVVADGNVDVVILIGAANAETIATLGPGAAFGDASLAQNAPRSASCVCREPVATLTMSREKYGELWAVNDPVGSVFRQAMLKNAVHQLQATQSRYVVLEKGASVRTEETLRGTPVSSVWRD